MGLPVAESSSESRPGILLLGPPNVGKRTILSRLLSVDFGDALDSSPGILQHGWTIDTKYYSADVSIWTADLDDGFSLGALPIANKLVALVMVFDLNDLASFLALKAWVMDIDTSRFDILLCIGNKVDLLPGHFAHAEYRRYLQKRGESSSDPHSEFIDFGIHDTEGSSLLGEDEAPWEIRRSCLDWCIQHNIEYVEACASNSDFDKCLSVNGDIQGMDRLHGALSSHMWTGMLLKSGNRIAESFSAEKEDSGASEEESESELEYEILSGGSAEPQDDIDESWSAFTEARVLVGNNEEGSTSQDAHTSKIQGIAHVMSDDTSVLMPILQSAPSQCESSPEDNPQVFILKDSSASCEMPNFSSGRESDNDREEADLSIGNSEVLVRENDRIELENGGRHLEYDDLEHLMSEIGNMRGNLRLMPDFQRREMAAKLAMKMAVMFGGGSDDEGLE